MNSVFTSLFMFAGALSRPARINKQCYRNLKSQTSAYYKLLQTLPKSPSSLDDATRTIILAAGHVAAGDLNAVVEAFGTIPKARRPVAFDLAVLQNIAFSGLPKALNASASLHQAGLIEPPPVSQSLTNTERRKLGKGVFHKVYGKAADKVTSRLLSFHPDVESWAVEFVYGTVMAARVPGLITLRERELCVIAVLAGLNVPPLLVGHLKGALNVGASKEELRAVLDHTRVVYGDEAVEHVEAVWATFERARYSL